MDLFLIWEKEAIYWRDLAVAFRSQGVQADSIDFNYVLISPL